MNDKKHVLKIPILLVMVLALAVPLLSAHDTAVLTGSQGPRVTSGVSPFTAGGVKVQDLVKAGVQGIEPGADGSLMWITRHRAGDNTLQARMRGGRPRRRPSKDRLALGKVKKKA
jgi:hypothetical protein